MLSLLLSAALLGGLGSSQRMGEVSPFAVAVAQVSHRAFIAEAGWDGAQKAVIAMSCCPSSAAGVDVRLTGRGC